MKIVEKYTAYVTNEVLPMIGKYVEYKLQKCIEIKSEEIWSSCEKTR